MQVLIRSKYHKFTLNGAELLTLFLCTIDSGLCDCGDHVKVESLLDEDQLKMQISYTLGGAPYYEQAGIDWAWDDLEN